MANKVTELPELLENIQRIIEDTEYEKKNVRSPKKKRSVELALIFFRSILFHLNAKIEKQSGK